LAAALQQILVGSILNERVFEAIIHCPSGTPANDYARTAHCRRGPSAISSPAKPGGNVTGNALIADHSKPLELLKEAVPGVSHVAFLYDPATRPGAYGQAKLTELQNHARTIDGVVNAVALSDPEGIDRVFAALPTDTDAILLENSTINLLAQERLCTLATQHRLPSVSTVGEVAEAGCLMKLRREFARCLSARRELCRQDFQRR